MLRLDMVCWWSHTISWRQAWVLFPHRNLAWWVSHSFSWFRWHRMMVSHLLKLFTIVSSFLHWALQSPRSISTILSPNILHRFKSLVYICIIFIKVSKIRLNSCRTFHGSTDFINLCIFISAPVVLKLRNLVLFLILCLISWEVIHWNAYITYLMLIINTNSFLRISKWWLMIRHFIYVLYFLIILYQLIIFPF